jgi:hypothetical protein
VRQHDPAVTWPDGELLGVRHSNNYFFAADASFDTAFGLLKKNGLMRVMENQKQGFAG